MNNKKIKRKEKNKNSNKTKSNKIKSKNFGSWQHLGICSQHHARAAPAAQIVNRFLDSCGPESACEPIRIPHASDRSTATFANKRRPAAVAALVVMFFFSPAAKSIHFQLFVVAILHNRIHPSSCQSLLYVLSLPPLTAAKHIIYD